MTKKFGFTLAEVLITLAIIGVVSAMTIPTLITSYKEKQTVTKLLKVYSVLNQAYRLAKIEHGEFATWFTGTSGRAEEDENGEMHYSEIFFNNQRILFNNLKSYLKTISEHTLANTTGKEFDRYYLNHNENTNTPDLDRQLVMNILDGISISNGYISNIDSCTPNKACADFNIDINGINTPPNMYGKDVFNFIITSENIIPGGSIYLKNSRKFPEYCDYSETTLKYNGFACAAWVIQNKNMDYLHCNDLSWNGKHKCSN